MRPTTRTCTLLALVLLAACTARDDAAPAAAAVTIDPANWPEQAPVLPRDPAIEARIADLLERMTLEEKVGQVIQADISAVTPDDVREYNLGSILNGGGSAPGGDNRATPEKWLALADEFWDASTDTSDGGIGIPAIWGTDAVHGHSNIIGATLFPHNIGLGMANDPDMMYDIGRVTAIEIRATGLDWTFAPTIAVVRNDRWGRTYEGYSEDPRIVAAYAPRIVEGLQGKVGTTTFLDDDHLMATAKHFTGDGGTRDGIDQGDTVVSEEALRDIHAAAYPAAIRAGVQSVMASFNSFQGRKMHGYQEMLTGVLVGRMGFDGFVVGDWNGHGQVAGCSNTSCAASFNAGLDMFMAPDSWKGIYKSVLEQVRSGAISEQRLDEAVSRILRVKLRAGVFEAGRPSSRPHAGNYALLGSPEHRAVARDAVRKSLVLLKNEGGVLPLAPDANVLVTGDGAHNIGKQSGGWTLNWQGTDNLREHFPNGTSIYEGLREAIEAGGGNATLSEDGNYAERPDVAVVVFGEEPYAEGVGDRPHVDYVPDDGLELLKRFREAGIPTVSVFISGRPMWVNPEMNRSDAFVAAWLPGSEGAGVADVLVAGDDAAPRHDFRGRLSFSWPGAPGQVEVNVGDADYDPLFPYGYGLSYAEPAVVGPLPEDAALQIVAGRFPEPLIEFGDPAGGRSLFFIDEGSRTAVSDSRGESANGALRAMPVDDEVQEDTLQLAWNGAAVFVVAGPPIDLSQAAAGDTALEIRYRVIESGATEILLGMTDGSMQRAAVDVKAAVTEQAGGEWTRAVIASSCFAEQGIDMQSIVAPLFISSDGPLTLQLSSARLVESTAGCEY